MSNAKFQITHPLRFFGFFGLFLVFMFLAVKSCSDRSKKTDFVNAENISELADGDQVKKNSEELNEFIEDVREDIKKQEKVQKKLSAKDIKKLEDKNIKKQKAREIKAKALKKEAAKKIAAKKDSTKLPSKPKAYRGATVLVKSLSGVDPYAKMQLKKSIKAINSEGSGKVTVYGSYFPGEKKSKGFVRAAGIKNQLIKFGLKPTISVFLLPEFRSKRDFSAKVKFQ